MARLALILNLVALLPAIAGAFFILLLAWVFFSSPAGGDKLTGALMLLLGWPLILAGPCFGLWLALSRPEAALSSSLIGAVCLLLALLSLWLLPGMIEAAARP